MAESNTFVTSCNKFKVFIENETRVKLSTLRYKAGKATPTVGSEFECCGTVVRVEEITDRFPIWVLWDNGVYSSYRSTDLIIVEETNFATDNPNITFKCKKQAKLVNPCAEIPL